MSYFLSDSSLFETEEEGQESTNKREEIKNLREENEKLKAHFKEACNFSQQVKDLKEENDSLKMQLKTEKREKAELEHRLELKNRSSQETEEVYEKEKKLNNEQRNNEIQQMYAKMNDLEAKHQNEIQEYIEQIQQLLDEKEQDDIQRKILSTKLNRIFQNASRYFDKDVSSLDSLIEVLSQKRPQQQNDSDQQNEEDSNEQKNDKESISKYKKKLKASQRQVEDLLRQLNQANGELNSLRTGNERKVKLMKAQIDSLKEENDFKDKQNRSQIETLENRIENLKFDLSKSKSEIISRNPRPDLTPIVSLPSDPNIPPPVANFPAPPSEEDEKEPAPPKTLQRVPSNKIQLLEDQIEVQKEEIDDLRARNQDLCDSLTENANKLRDTELALSKKVNEYTSLLSVHQQTVEEVKSMREIIRSRQRNSEEAQKALYEQKQKDEKTKKIVEAARKKIDSLKSELLEAQKENLRQQETVDNQKREIESLQEENKELENALTTSQQEVAILNEEKENIKPLTANDLLPPSAYVIPSADSALNEQIRPIAENPSLQPTSKLQNIIQTINNYYEGQIEEMGRELSELEDDVATRRNILNQFFIDSSILLFEEPFTYEQFFEEKAGQTIVEEIAKITTEHDSQKHAIEKYEEFASAFEQQFGESDNQVKQVKEIKDLIDAAIAQNDKRKAQYNKLKQAFKDLEAQTETTILNLKKENKELLEDNDGLKSSLKETGNKLKRANDENTKLAESLEQEKTQRELMENELSAHNTRHLEELDLLKSREQELKHAELKKLHDTNKKQEDLIHELNDEIHRLSEQNSALDLKNKDLLKEVNGLRGQNDSVIVNIKQAHEAEKTHMQATFEVSLAELREQCEKHRSDLRVLSEQLANEEQFNSSIKCQYEDLKKENNKLARKVKLVKEEAEREKMLMESDCKVKISSAESSFKQKLDNEKAKANEQKQNIYNYIADQFSKFYKGSQKIDDASFKTIISKVREVLCRTTESDLSIRKMVDAADGQTTEDAVAQLLLPSSTSALH